MIKLKRYDKGFTLLELMVVLAITAILAVIALPAMNRLVATQRLNTRTDQLIALFQFARSEALRTNKPVLICPTAIRKDVATANSCVTFNNYDDGKGWQGFMAFNDMDLNGKYDATNDNSIKVVAINQNISNNASAAEIKSKLKTKISAISMSCTSQSNGSNSFRTCINRHLDSNYLGFMPNGQFGIGSGENKSNWSIGDTYIIIELTDSESKADLKRRVIILPSGNTYFCGKKSSNLSLCTADMTV